MFIYLHTLRIIYTRGNKNETKNNLFELRRKQRKEEW